MKGMIVMAFCRLSEKPNRDVMSYAKEKKVFVYQIADVLGILPTSLSIKLNKREMSVKDKQTVYEIIDELTEQRAEA